MLSTLRVSYFIDVRNVCVNVSELEMYAFRLQGPVDSRYDNAGVQSFSTLFAGILQLIERCLAYP